jgi:hypothetical protein
LVLLSLISLLSTSFFVNVLAIDILVVDVVVNNQARRDGGTSGLGGKDTALWAGQWQAIINDPRVCPIELNRQLGRHHAEGGCHRTRVKGGTHEGTMDKIWCRWWRGAGLATLKTTEVDESGRGWRQEGERLV